MLLDQGICIESSMVDSGELLLKRLKGSVIAMDFFWLHPTCSFFS